MQSIENLALCQAKGGKAFPLVLLSYVCNGLINFSTPRSVLKKEVLTIFLSPTILYLSIYLRE